MNQKKIPNSRTKSLFISEAVRDTPMVTMDHCKEVIGSRSTRVSINTR